jgi:hypothetical protein
MGDGRSDTGRYPKSPSLLLLPNQAFHKLLSRISLHIEHGQLLQFSTLALKDFKVVINEVLRECTLYLKPESEGDTADNWFEA